MFGISRSRLVAGLHAVGLLLCDYAGKGATQRSRCDCKFGFTGQRTQEQNGCPEVWQAHEIINALTPTEFRRVCKRARVMVSRHDEEPPSPRRPTRKAKP